MDSLVDSFLRDCIGGRDRTGARVVVFKRIRDIPYAIELDLIHPQQYIRILELNRGSCTPKHFLLCAMFQRLGLDTLYACFPFRWGEVELDYPPGLRKLAEALPVSYHLACRVEIEGSMVLVDATLDPQMRMLGLPVNSEWDGRSDTALPMRPCGDEEIYHPSEAGYIQVRRDAQSLIFYDELNRWLDESRAAWEAM
jgi:hypothetical protein